MFNACNFASYMKKLRVCTMLMESRRSTFPKKNWRELGCKWGLIHKKWKQKEGMMFLIWEKRGSSSSMIFLLLCLGKTLWIRKNSHRTFATKLLSLPMEKTLRQHSLQWIFLTYISQKPLKVSLFSNNFKFGNFWKLMAEFKLIVLEPLLSKKLGSWIQVNKRFFAQK